MIRLWLIRHSLTAGNLKKRYIGTTDEPLCQEGIELLKEVAVFGPERLFISPLKRCRETGELLFPGMEQVIIPELSECDFGEFENKNYLELSGNPHYQQWIDSGGTLAFPGGESREEFRKRTLDGLEKAVTQCISEGITDAALVVHGGTIMNVMETYGEPERDFYGWHTENAHGYLVSLEEKEWQAGRKKLVLLKDI